MPPAVVDIGALIDRYEALLIDAYGVLVTQGGPLADGVALIDELHRRGRRFFVVTNDASRLPETIGARLRGFGMQVGDDEVIAAGALLTPWFARNQLAGSRCLVLGTDDSRAYVERAGGVVAAIDPAAEVDVIAVCDDAGFPFLAGCEAALTIAFRMIDAGRPPRLVLPNPDLLYPKGGGEWGFTSGAVALLLEAGLERRYGAGAPRCERLGKPHPPLFDEAARRAGTRSLLMIGDQLETDIAGARRAGLDAALLTTGVSRWTGEVAEALAPTYLLSSVRP
jgi:ribonucleotide monophosphatase NagD (HAD superfamily)